MAKDPAFLFYTQDFHTGTQFFTDEQVGKYIRLLCAQHQHGHLSEKHMLSICRAYDEDVLSKFKKDSEGKYYNERLENEIQKRKAYTESRRRNALNPKKKGAHDEHMLEHMENENENESEIENKSIQAIVKTDTVSKPQKKQKPKAFIPPTVEDVIEYFRSNGYTEEAARKAYRHYELGNWHDSKGSPVLSWKQKMYTNWFKEENKVKSNVVTMPARGVLTDKDFYTDAEYQEYLRKQKSAS